MIQRGKLRRSFAFSSSIDGVRDSRRGEHGFTLVELMISLVISSVIVFFLFAIQGRMSSAFRGQGTVSEINQNLRGARQMLVHDIRMAGFGLGTLGKVHISNAYSGVTTTQGDVVLGLTVSNGVTSDEDDSFRSLYAGASSGDMASTVAVTGGGFNVETQLPTTFSIGDVVVIAGSIAGNQRIACIAQISKATVLGTGSLLEFQKEGKPFNDPNGTQCSPLTAASGVSIRSLVARAYRIVPTSIDANAGFLQMSLTGGVEDDWQDMGAGFTNLQLATRYSNENSVADLDLDGNVIANWFSSDNQTDIAKQTILEETNQILSLIEATISIEARSPFGTRNAAASISTPAYTVAGQTSNNPLGDWGTSCATPSPALCGVDLANTNDTGRPLRYAGDFVYRHTTASVDLRNMGIGR